MNAWNNYHRISHWVLTGFACILVFKLVSDALILFALPLGNYQARLQLISPFTAVFFVASLACAAFLKLLEYHYLGSLTNLRAEKGYMFRITTPTDMLELVKSDSPQFKNGPDSDSRALIYRRSLRIRSLFGPFSSVIPCFTPSSCSPCAAADLDKPVKNIPAD